MKEFTTHYTIVGSAALEKQDEGYQGTKRIITFPKQPRHAKPEQMIPSVSHGQTKTVLSDAFERMDMVQDFLHGSLRGKRLGNAKRWHTLFAGTCFFAAALIVVLFGV